MSTPEEQQETTPVEAEAKPSEPEQPEQPQEQEQPEPAAAAEGEAEEEPKPKPEEQLSDSLEPDDEVPRVLVTGASGYIATHIIQQLLQQGRFRVRGTVRSLKREEKVEPLRSLVPDAKYPLRLIEADLNKPDTWKKAVESCTYVYHVASPFVIKAPKPSEVDRELIQPAVEGTNNVLKACAEAGTVRRVVVTSSVAAVSAGNVGNPNLPPDHVYSEEDWSHEPSCGAYVRSKLLAEKAAWDYVKGLEEDKRFELAVVNPGYVLGPVLTKSSGDSSKAFVIRLLENEMPGVFHMSTGVIDVREVAAAHIAAMEKPEAAGGRFLLVAETVTFQQIAQIISDEFKPQGYKVPVRTIPKPMAWVFKFFNDEVKELYPGIGKNVVFNNERMRRILGIEPRPFKETLLDMCYNLIELGIVHKAPGYLGHPSTRPKEEAKPQEPGEGEAKAKEEEPKSDEPGEGEGEEPKSDQPGEGEAAKGEEPKSDEPGEGEAKAEEGETKSEES